MLSKWYIVFLPLTLIWLKGPEEKELSLPRINELVDMYGLFLHRKDGKGWIGEVGPSNFELSTSLSLTKESIESAPALFIRTYFAPCITVSSCRFPYIDRHRRWMRTDVDRNSDRLIVRQCQTLILSLLLLLATCHATCNTYCKDSRNSCMGNEHVSNWKMIKN